MNTRLKASLRHSASAEFDHTIPAQMPWSGIIRQGQILRIVDCEGQQAVDTLSTLATLGGELRSAIVHSALSHHLDG